MILRKSYSKSNSSYNKWYHYLVVNIPMEREAVTIRFPADLLGFSQETKIRGSNP
jgi:hypothetical protein